MLWDESGRPIPVTNQGPIILHKFHYISSSYYRKIVAFSIEEYSTRPSGDLPSNAKSTKSNDFQVIMNDDS